LLGIAFEPFYHLNRRFYVTYTDASGALTLVRYHASGDSDLADADSAEPLLTISKKDPLHNGGMIAFGRDGYLFMSVGDGNGRSFDEANNGQDRRDLFGSILRLEVRGHDYTIPVGNPFRAPNRPELWNYGLRNPWRFSFDRVSGDLYIADVGAATREEIDLADYAHGLGRGANYGWRTFEGSQCTNVGNCNRSGTTAPVLEYSHEQGCAVVGGYVYRGAAIPNLRGTYFFGDYCGGWVKSFRYSGGEVTAKTEWPSLTTGSQITSFGEDAAGEIYVLTSAGDVLRIVETR
jgi:glucose/arabinose dehydrogenase